MTLDTVLSRQMGFSGMAPLRHNMWFVATRYKTTDLSPPLHLHNRQLPVVSFHFPFSGSSDSREIVLVEGKRCPVLGTVCVWEQLKPSLGCIGTVDSLV